MPNLPWTKRTVLALNIVNQCHGAQVVNVHHLEATTAKDTAIANDEAAIVEAQDVANDWLTTCKGPYLNGHGVEFTILRVSAQVIERNGQFRRRLSPVEVTPTGQVVGDATLGAIENTTTSAVIKWRTPIAGKRHRGRTYYGPLARNQEGDGRLTATGTTNINLYVTALMGLWGPSGTENTAWRLTVYSRPFNQGEYEYTTRKNGPLEIVRPLDYAGDSTWITSHSIDPILRVQRRRELGVGS